MEEDIPVWSKKNIATVLKILVNPDRVDSSAAGGAVPPAGTATVACFASGIMTDGM
jgi:hypothetical protein